MSVRYAALVRLGRRRPAYNGHSSCALIPVICRMRPEQKVLPHATNGRQDGNTGCKGAFPGPEPHKTSFLFVVERLKSYNFATGCAEAIPYVTDLCDGTTLTVERLN